jgi:hypothetical protein
MSPFYDILDSLLIGALIVVVMWLVIAYCKSEFYDSDDDGDETTY